jgi:hypothetical protein
LVLGNIVSIVIGSIWIVKQKTPAPTRPTMRHLLWLGGWLLASGLSRTVTRYAIQAFLNIVAGVASLGFVEGARVVSQPVNVLSQGLMAQIGPRLTRSAATRDPIAARKWSIRFAVLLGAAAGPYVLLTALPVPLNPFTHIAPRAYVIPGLTAATLVVVFAGAFLRSYRMQLLGARLQKRVAWVTTATGVFELVLIGTGVLIGVYASPLAAGVSTIIGLVWLARENRRAYSG